jgi:hypothetical protein
MGNANGGNGAGAEGGGILNDATCILTVSNCFMEGCQAIGGRGGDAFGTSVDPAANGGNGAVAYGGAIGSEGNLILHCCSFASNSATAGDGGNGVAGGAGGNGGAALMNLGPFGAAGGAIYAGYSGALEIVDCTFYANYAIGGNGGRGGDGHVEIPQMPSNGGPGGNGSDASGGGIYITKGCDPGSCAGIKHDTVNQNVCSPGIGGQGGLGFDGGNAGANGKGGAAKGCGLYASAALPLGNNIIAANYALPTTLNPAGPDVWGAIFSDAQTGMHNLIGAVDVNSAGWTPIDLTGSPVNPLNPLLGPLQNNGGETWTMAPLAGSPAIDAGTINGALMDTSAGIFIDQIRQLRTVIVAGIANNGDGTDIGAYELQCSLDVPTLSISQSVTNIVISWPWPSACWVLQQNSDLSTPNWVNCVYPVSVSGNRNQVVISPPQGNLFFRLKK